MLLRKTRDAESRVGMWRKAGMALIARVALAV
ncbi:hypothetical protein RAZWK3B_13494 [Roseobacter sp. AzwK-3b]|nr:hypothetical protein RAZWK3B_13494 [Roseobacter sp. AzwK-3b]